MPIALEVERDWLVESGCPVFIVLMYYESLVTMTCIDRTRPNEYLKAISNLGFEQPKHQISRSYTDGVFGEAVVGRSGSAVIVGDLVELSGCFDREVYDYVARSGESHLVEPPLCWIDGIRKMLPDRFLPYVREAFKPLRPSGGDAARNLESLMLTVGGLPVEISPIDESDKETILGETWSADWIANTISMVGVDPRVFGFIARLGDRVVGGIGCYTVYRAGVEIQVDTHADYRRRGIATALAKRMTAECGARSLACHWDAMNAKSAALARRVGFVSDHTYRCFEFRARKAR